jgi:cbb3-type cytochrome oxidase subunit 3
VTGVLISLAFNLVLIAFIAALWREGRKSEREAARRDALREQERRQLLDRIMYLSGSPWSPPPSEEIEMVESVDPYEPYDPTQVALNV